MKHSLLTNFKIGFDPCAINKIMEVRELDEIEKIMCDTCEGARMSTYISPDMKLIPCSFACHDDYSVQLSDDMPIGKAWYSITFKDFRNTIIKNKPVCPIGL